MTRLQVWAWWNIGVVALNAVVFLAMLAVVGMPEACFAGVVIWLLVPGILVLFRHRDGGIRLALDERDKAILQRGFVAGLVVLLLVLVGGGAAGAATGGEPVVFAVVLLLAGYLTVLAISSRILFGAARE